MPRSSLLYTLAVKLWPLDRAINFLGRLPLVGALLRPIFSADGNEVVILPVQETVQGTESVVLPYPVLSSLVERASERVLIRECLCRTGKRCQTYPRDLGCLFLGEGAAQIAPELGRPVGVEEALAHVERAISLGLLPLIIHNSFDAWLLRIPYRRMVVVCFCCDCCCTVLQSLRLGPPAFRDTVLRLPGLSVVVGERCTGCGLCLSACPVGSIGMEDGRARIGEECKGCGRCAGVCPTGAITLRVAEDADTVERLLARIGQRTDIGL